MREKLEEIKKNALDVLQKATDIDALEEARIKFLGKKGELTAVLKGMGQLSKEERPQIGALANEIRGVIENHIDTKKAEISEKLEEIKLKSEVIDVTMPGKAQKTGKLHPLTKVMNNIKDTFIGMGFEIAEGPEVELDYYNFEALNIPPNHPARDTQDTFYINENTVLRTQTSPIQVRVMEKKKPPIRIIAPGRVYRSDAVDATHSPVFHQIEGLVVDKGITMAVCKGEGWIEVLGCGMVHPKVLANCGIDPEVYSGFAFGIGLERIAMGKYDINDLRLFFENDLRFLDQF